MPRSGRFPRPPFATRATPTSRTTSATPTVRAASSSWLPHYQRALQLDPRHRGAHEYIGEAYLIANNLAKAEEHLASLQRICLIPCEEYEDLKKAVSDYRARAPK
jgi:hypothetical protein